MANLVIFGTGQIAEVAHYYFSEDSGYDVAGFTVDRDYLQRSEVMGLPVVPFEEAATRFPPDDFELFVAMGYRNLNADRAAKVAAARAIGYRLAHYVSSRAWVWSGFEPRDNQFIMEHNTVQPYVTIGENTTLWSGNHIGHHTAIGANVFIASHVVVSGSVTVGDNCFLGVNATVADNLTIGSGCVLGAGALVVRSAPDNTVFPGAASEPSKVPSNRLRSI
jgi:sugar O-acyltransferase (sialic acid O-acetyltransferase NeuD family)